MGSQQVGRSGRRIIMKMQQQVAVKDGIIGREFHRLPVGGRGALGPALVLEDAGRAAVRDGRIGAKAEDLLVHAGSFLQAAGFLQGIGEIEARFEERRMQGDGLAEVLGRLFRPTYTAQRRSQVIQGFGRVFRTRGDRLLVVRHCFGEISDLLQQIGQGVMGIRVPGIELQCAQVAQRGVFQVAGLLHQGAQVGEHLDRARI
jgi:hypothetical protein